MKSAIPSGLLYAKEIKKVVASVLFSIPLTGHCLSYDEFDLFWLDAENKPIKANIVDEFADSPLRIADDVAELHVRLGALQSSKKRLAVRKRADAGACRVSLAKAFLQCEAGTGLLSGAYYSGTEFPSQDGKAIGHGKQVDDLFAKYLAIEEYGAMQFAFTCRDGCGGKPKQILLIWHGD